MVIRKDEEKFENAMGQYEKIRKALGGLYEIMDINFHENDIYRLTAIDNLKAINESIVEMLGGTFTTRDVRIRMRELEFDEIDAEESFPL